MSESSISMIWIAEVLLPVKLEVPNKTQSLHKSELAPHLLTHYNNIMTILHFTFFITKLREISNLIKCRNVNRVGAQRYDGESESPSVIGYVIIFNVLLSVHEANGHSVESVILLLNLF
jgi:hypothetical protein